jgi:hypothetical protein
MRSAKDMRQSFAYPSALPEWAGSTVKYDNRAYALQSLALWASAENPGAKLGRLDGVPENDAAMLLAEGYETALSE